MRLPAINDHRLEQIIGRLLQTGVLTAVVIVAVGGAKWLTESRALPADRKVFVGEPADLESVAGTISRAGRLDAQGLIQLGLLVLIATPIARVIFSVYAFWREGDRLYIAITCVVLGMLLVSLV
jgi:uncharacterized membrane protein